MRIVCLVANLKFVGHQVVVGPYANGADPKILPLDLSDRIANKEAFPGEKLIRLPRRFTKAWKRYFPGTSLSYYGPFLSFDEINEDKASSMYVGA